MDAHDGTDVDLAERFRSSARAAGRRAPLYRRLGEATATDPAVARLLLHAPSDQRLPVLLFACVHWILLREPDHDLRRWYPNLVPDPGTDDPYPAFRRFCLDNEERLADLLATRTTQTNEIGRSALLVPLLARAAGRAGPLALLDVGTSAGLNLLFDRFRYRYDRHDDASGVDASGVDASGDPGRGSSVVGPPSPVELVCGTRGPVPVPSELPAIVDRVGLDRAPIDPSDPAEADWLRACVWPDQADRFDRLGAALEMAAGDPPRVVRGDAVDDLLATAARLDPAGHLVLTHTWVLNYLPTERRRAFTREIERLATTRDLTWCALESPTLTEGLPWPDDVDEPDLTHLLVTTWRAGRATVEHLGTAHPHGYWLHWDEPIA